MSLKDIALPMARRGVRQVPSLNPRDRFPGPKDWPVIATTNEAQILAWDANGYHDYNSCSVADNDVLIVDVDNYEQAKALGFPIIKTLAVRTPSGGYHLYYRQTEASRALGNRAMGKVLELKSYSAAVAAPGCIRDDKPGEYAIRWDEPLSEFHKSQVDWIEKNIPKKRRQGAVPVVEDFDFEDFCAHYEIGVVGYNGIWHITDVCPLAGVRHTGSKFTGFSWDGEYLGFNCFSDDCAGNTIGGVLRHLNETHASYPKRIWPEEETDLEVDWLEAAEETQEVKEVSKATTTTPQETHTLEEFEEIVNEKNGIKYPELRFPYEALTGRFKELVDKACEGGVGVGLVVPALMTLASSIPVYDVMCGQRICLYTCLLAMVGAGKDVAIMHARLTLGMGDHWHKKLFTNYSPSGEKVLAMTIGDRLTKRGSNERTAGPKRHCLISTELESTLNKAKAETSGVLQAIQRLWDSNYDLYPDSKSGGTITVNCRLSWLASLPVGKNEIDVELFRQAFGTNTQGGVVSRITFGFTEQRVDSRKLRYWQPPVATPHTTVVTGQKIDGDLDVVQEELLDHSLLEELRTFRVEDWRPEVGKQLDAWEVGEDMSGRDTQHIQKAAIISALLNGHQYVEQEDFDFAVAYMKCQTAIRKVFSTGLGKSAAGQFNETIVETVRRKSAKYKKDGKDMQQVEGFIFVRWKKLAQDGNWHQYGPDIERTIDALVRGGLLAYLIETDSSSPDGRTKKEKNKKWVRLSN